MKRIWLSMVLAFLCLSVLCPLNIQAGDENNPEIMDSEGDAVSDMSSRDILWGYMGHETNDTVALVMGLSSLETFTNPNDIMKFPVTDYEFYFSVLGVDYAAVATVPVHGPFGIDIMYELRTVQYNGSMPSSETQSASISTADYDPVNGIINMTVRKSDIGNPSEGTLAENLWLAVYSRQRDGFNLTEPTLEDRGPNSGYGKKYIFRGSVGNEIIRIEISTDDVTSANITPFEQLKFDINVYNNGTTTLIINMNQSTIESWRAYIVPATLTLEPQEGTNVTLVVKILDLKKVKDGDKVAVQVWAETNIGNETSPKLKFSNYLTFSITADVPPPAEEDKSGFEKFMEGLTDFFEEQGMNLLYAIIAIVVLVVVIGVALSFRKGKKEGEDEGEFSELNIKVDDSEDGASD